MDKGIPGTKRHPWWRTAVQKCLPPLVKTIAANGQSVLPSPVSLKLPLTQLERLRRNIDDPAALLGGAKELIEAIAKFVLEEGGLYPDPRIPFPGLIDLSFERLSLLPAVVGESSEGTRQIREIYRSAKKTVIAINELRNLQGTGHGRTLPTGVTTEAARYVIREATHVAELMLTTHDRLMGR